MVFCVKIWSDAIERYFTKGNIMSEYRKEQDEERKAREEAAAYKARDKAAKEDTSNRSAGVSNVVGDSKAVQQGIANEKLHLNPPPLVHVDPSTGIPIDKPYYAPTAPNVLTTPGTDKPTVSGNDPVRNAAAQASLEARHREEQAAEKASKR